MSPHKDGRTGPRTPSSWAWGHSWPDPGPSVRWPGKWELGLKEANLSIMSKDNALLGAVWTLSSAHHIHENAETMALATKRSRNEDGERNTGFWKASSSWASPCPTWILCPCSVGHPWVQHTFPLWVSQLTLASVTCNQKKYCLILHLSSLGKVLPK